MNPSKVFGTNLRKLCESQPSISFVAKTLGINRIQFTRYLNGESYPKPAVLKNIVEYFGVDARIFTEPLSVEQLAASYAGKAPEVHVNQAVLGMHGLEYVLAGRESFGPFPRLPNECVVMWRRSFSTPDMYFSMMVKFDVHKGCKVVRGYEPPVRTPQLLLDTGHPKAGRVNKSEIRGLVSEMGAGFLITYFPPYPRVTVCSSYIHFDDFWADDGLLPGVSMLNRLPKSGVINYSNTVLEFIPQNLAAIIACGRARGFHKAHDVPERIRTYLDSAP